MACSRRSCGGNVLHTALRGCREARPLPPGQLQASCRVLQKGTLCWPPPPLHRKIPASFSASSCPEDHSLGPSARGTLPESSVAVLLTSSPNHQLLSLLRTFARAVPSAWNSLPRPLHQTVVYPGNSGFLLSHAKDLSGIISLSGPLPGIREQEPRRGRFLAGRQDKKSQQ